MSHSFKSRRLVSIDYARAFAIALALLSHLYLNLVQSAVTQEVPVVVEFITRTATPMFVFMFGFMIHYAYLNMAIFKGNLYVKVRSLRRALQCYLAYAIISVTSFLGGHKILLATLGSFLFFADSRFGNILRIYFMVLIMLPFIVFMLIRFGRYFIYFSLVLLIIWGYIKDLLVVPDLGMFNSQLNILLGVGLDFGGPSVAGAGIFIFLGMLVSDFMNRMKSRGNVVSCCGLLIVAFILLLFLSPDNLHDIFIGFYDFDYRSGNNINYFIVGSISSLIYFSFFLAFENYIPTSVFVAKIAKSSLLLYFAGNVFLNLTFSLLSLVGIVSYVIGFILFLLALTVFRDKIPGVKFIDSLLEFRFITNLIFTDKYSKGEK